MNKRRLKIIAGGATVAALGLGGAAMAGNGTTGSDDVDQKLTGPQAERAAEAAVKATGGGSATAVERDSDGRALYEVEVTRSNGSTVDVDVDESFRLIATDEDSEREGADRDDADDRNETEDRDDANERDDADDRNEPDDRDDAGERDDD